MITIYAIVNLINGKMYIGKTSNLSRRIKNHFEKTHNVKLKSAFAKYGKENFEVRILDVVEVCFADEKEKACILEYNSIKNGYNLTNGGEGGNTLIDPIIAQNHRLASSNGRRGLKRKPFSSEHKKKLVEILAANKTSKAILIDDKYYESQHEAARQLKIPQSTIQYRLRTGVSGYKYYNNFGE